MKAIQKLPFAEHLLGSWHCIKKPSLNQAHPPSQSYLQAEKSGTFTRLQWVVKLEFGLICLIAKAGCFPLPHTKSRASLRHAPDMMGKE